MIKIETKKISEEKSSMIVETSGSLGVIMNELAISTSKILGSFLIQQDKIDPDNFLKDYTDYLQSTLHRTLGELQEEKENNKIRKRRKRK